MVTASEQVAQLRFKINNEGRISVRVKVKTFFCLHYFVKKWWWRLCESNYIAHFHQHDTRMIPHSFIYFIGDWLLWKCLRITVVMSNSNCINSNSLFFVKERSNVLSMHCKPASNSDCPQTFGFWSSGDRANRQLQSASRVIYKSGVINCLIRSQRCSKAFQDLYNDINCDPGTVS